MPLILKNTPLVALEAVVLDTETTGLDISKARIIELGIMPHGQSGSPVQGWSSLVNPGMAIPAASQAIHGIDDAMVKTAPPFSAVWAEAQKILGRHVIIGHSLGFDLAILKNECQRAQLPWQEPIWLDTRYLAILLDARLPNFTVSALTAWLELPVENSHPALADARATSAIFSALLPRLRSKGIHTFGEALAACRRVQTMGQDLMRSGWVEAPATAVIKGSLLQDTSNTTVPFDAYPFQHRVATLMSHPPAFLLPTETLNTALKVLAEKQISSLFIGKQDDPASTVGIITERDILRVLAKKGAAALDQKIAPLASHPLVTIRDGAFVYRAIGTMARLGIRHLAVVSDDHPRIVGALSQRDLLRLRAQSSITLGDDIDEASSTAALGRSWAKLPWMAHSLLDEGIVAPEIAGIIARELGALTRRAAVLAEREMVKAGKGPAPTDYGVLVLGSAGRGESLLAMDQDNAVVFAEGEPSSAIDQWFAEHGARFAAILNEVGVPLCTGGVMAREASFRGSVKTWEERMNVWLTRSDPQDLLNVDIVFDARTVHGNPAMFTALLEKFRTAASQNAAFLKLMIASHPDGRPPVGLFGALKADEDGRIDLKRHLVSRIVSAARIFAIRDQQPARSTRDRLALAVRQHPAAVSELELLSQAYERAQGFVLRAQLATIADGLKPDNRVALARVTALDKMNLKEDLQRVSDLGEFVRTAVF